jgi:hypothetical protein
VIDLEDPLVANSVAAKREGVHAESAIVMEVRHLIANGILHSRAYLLVTCLKSTRALIWAVGE